MEIARCYFLAGRMQPGREPRIFLTAQQNSPAVVDLHACAFQNRRNEAGMSMKTKDRTWKPWNKAGMSLKTHILTHVVLFRIENKEVTRHLICNYGRMSFARASMWKV